MSSIDDLPIRPDKPKRFVISQQVGLLISLVALGVSVVSFMDSRKNAVLQRELSRPLLEADNVTMSSTALDDGLHVGIGFKLKNIGHLTAFVTEAVMQPSVEIDQIALDPHADKVSEANRCLADSKKERRNVPSHDQKEISPGSTRTSVVIFNLPATCSGVEMLMSLKIIVTYHDGTNTQYVQPIDAVAVENSKR